MLVVGALVNLNKNSVSHPHIPQPSGNIIGASQPADGVTVVQFPENVLGGPEAVELSALVRDSLGSGTTLLVFDCGEVAVMNSSGLGMLVSALTSVRNAGTQLRLANLPEKVSSLLSMTQLDKVFEIRDTVEAAMKE